MSDPGRDGAGPVDEDRLPWLEPVDDEDMPEGGVAAGKLLGAVLAALVAIGLIIGGSFWLRQRNTQVAEGGPATIPAPPGPYKIKPVEPGGMQVPGQGDASYSASAGADPNAAIDLNAVPEAPVKPSPAAVPPAPRTPAKPTATVQATLPATSTRLAAATPPAAKPATVAVPAPVPAAKAAGGPAVQLGAFSSEAKATAAWKSLAGRFAYLAPLQQQVVSATVGSGTVYRLRVNAGAQSSNICAKLKVAGETCIVIGG
jgi:cell division septation protein DedD